jgi:hypothetical protein
MVVTALTSQAPIAPLNVDAVEQWTGDEYWLNRLLMSVTPDVSHVLMSPYIALAAAEFEHHAPTAV